VLSHFKIGVLGFTDFHAFRFLKLLQLLLLKLSSFCRLTSPLSSDLMWVFVGCAEIRQFEERFSIYKLKILSLINLLIEDYKSCRYFAFANLKGLRSS
jgi:hypothetical protein